MSTTTTTTANNMFETITSDDAPTVDSVATMLRAVDGKQRYHVVRALSDMLHDARRSADNRADRSRYLSLVDMVDDAADMVAESTRAARLTRVTVDPAVIEATVAAMVGTRGDRPDDVTADDWTAMVDAVDASVRSIVDKRLNGITRTKVRGTIGDLVGAGILHEGDTVVGAVDGATIAATVGADGLHVEGYVGVYSNPSAAAKIATGAESINGWKFWRVGDGTLLGDLRTRL